MLIFYQEKKHMKDKIFIDTNIFLYAFSDKDIGKQVVAKGIFSMNIRYTISEQVINECSVNLIKKFKFREEDIKSFVISSYKRFEVFGLDKDILLYSSDIRERYGYSYFDSIILATAIKSNCTILYSEDMQHNQIIENQLRIINPFL
jgi:predicted nucleic acid-binding protein